MDTFFYSRIDDLFVRAERGETVCSPFYNESEAYEAQKYLGSQRRSGYLFYGGFEGAQRKRLFVFPEWLEPDVEPTKDFISPVLICGSGYVKLDHRSYLGSLVGTGLSRDVIGDIALQDDRSAVVFLDSRIADFLTGPTSTLERIGRDKVKITPYLLPDGFTASVDVVGISSTVASARLDCVVSELVNLSREKTKSLISSGLVTHNYAEVSDFSADVCQGDVISIRGYGKFRIEGIGEKTKKDRIRLHAVKYV
ncbi:MAG: hypothetical protein IJD17_03635 [Clostridia bacterium]|nr:hypothetical protein [Clostridia bacterium]